MLFLWRPRPPTLLPDERQKEIRKNLKKYYAQFESKDRVRMTRASKELLEKRAKLREQFVEYRAKRVNDWEEQKYRRMQLRNSKRPLSLRLKSSSNTNSLPPFQIWIPIRWRLIQTMWRRRLLKF